MEWHKIMFSDVPGRKYPILFDDEEAVYVVIADDYSSIQFLHATIDGKKVAHEIIGMVDAFCFLERALIEIDRYMSILIFPETNTWYYFNECECGDSKIYMSFDINRMVIDFGPKSTRSLTIQFNFEKFVPAGMNMSKSSDSMKDLIYKHLKEMYSNLIKAFDDIKNEIRSRVTSNIQHTSTKPSKSRFNIMRYIKQDDEYELVLDVNRSGTFEFGLVSSDKKFESIGEFYNVTKSDICEIVRILDYCCTNNVNFLSSIKLKFGDGSITFDEDEIVLRSEHELFSFDINMCVFKGSWSHFRSAMNAFCSTFDEVLKIMYDCKND